MRARRWARSPEGNAVDGRRARRFARRCSLAAFGCEGSRLARLVGVSEEWNAATDLTDVRSSVRLDVRGVSSAIEQRFDRVGTLPCERRLSGRRRFVSGCAEIAERNLRPFAFGAEAHSCRLPVLPRAVA